MIKKAAIFSTFVLMLTIVLSVCVCAADYVNVRYNDETGILSVSANIGECANLPVAVFAAEENKILGDDGEVSDYPFSDMNSPDLAHVCLTKDGGTLRYDFKLSDNFNDGIYYVYVMSELGSVHRKAYIYGEASTGEIVDKCNTETDKNALALYISNSKTGEYMGYGNDTIAEYASDIADFIIKSRYTDYTHKTLRLSIGKAIALAMIEDGIDKDFVLMEYSSCFGWNYDDYKNLDNDTKKEFTNLIYNIDFTDNRLQTDFDSLVLLAMVRNASVSWSELKDLFENNASELGVNMGNGSDYAKLQVSDRPEVFEKMKNELKNIIDFSEIANLFDNAVNAVKNATDESSGSGGGSSGGSSSKGGSSGGASSISSVPFVPQAEQVKKISYADIDNHFSKEAVEFLSAKKIINGYSDGTFKPNNPVTRAEFAKMVSLAFSIEEKGENIFEDVKNTDWFYNPINALSHNKILLGDGIKFHPLAQITRQDATVVVWRALSYCGKSYEGNSAFNDIDEVSSYATDAVGAMFNAGVVKGSGNSFFPLNPITRGEAAVIIYRAFKLGMGV